MSLRGRPPEGTPVASERHVSLPALFLASFKDCSITTRKVDGTSSATQFSRKFMHDTVESEGALSDEEVEELAALIEAELEAQQQNAALVVRSRTPTPPLGFQGLSPRDPPPELLPPDLTRRGGLYIAPSRVPIESGPSAGSTLQQPGLFTSVAIPAGGFICMYTGHFFPTESFESLPDARRDALSRYAVEVEDHEITAAPPLDGTGSVDFAIHTAAAANEPSKSNEANAFIEASVIEVGNEGGEVRFYLVICMFACRPLSAGTEILWNYGEGYEPQRELAGYKAGSACSDQEVDGLRRPSLHGRVAAILEDGSRSADALFEIEQDSSGESSSDDEEWVPVKRRRGR